jgi:hypothetical protein
MLADSIFVLVSWRSLAVRRLLLAAESSLDQIDILVCCCGRFNWYAQRNVPERRGQLLDPQRVDEGWLPSRGSKARNSRRAMTNAIARHSYTCVDSHLTHSTTSWQYTFEPNPSGRFGSPPPPAQSLIASFCCGVGGRIPLTTTMRMISHCCSFALTMMLMVSLLATMLPILRVSAFTPSSISFEYNMRRSAGAIGTRTMSPPPGTLYMAGFGAATSSSSSSGDSASKLKPKGQWDRYLDLKQATSYTVGVKEAADESDNDGDWLVVGQVRCRDETLLTAAVARQRGLIADHAKRLFPLKVTPQIKLAWGYFQTTGDATSPSADGSSVSGQWVVVDPKAADVVAGQKDFDKSIGYEGTPDPSTGYYCTYNEGRLVGTTVTVSKTAGGGSGEPVVAKKSIRPSSKSK